MIGNMIFSSAFSELFAQIKSMLFKGQKTKEEPTAV
jgi:hypothetical protein